ncbi:hypothetical protein ACOSQ2_014658 [Xanthoceras sorbifolium]
MTHDMKKYLKLMNNPLGLFDRERERESICGERWRRGEMTDESAATDREMNLRREIARRQTNLRRQKICCNRDGEVRRLATKTGRR